MDDKLLLSPSVVSLGCSLFLVIFACVWEYIQAVITAKQAGIPHRLLQAPQLLFCGFIVEVIFVVDRLLLDGICLNTRILFTIPLLILLGIYLSFWFYFTVIYYPSAG